MMLDQENKINTTSPQGRTNSSRAFFSHFAGLFH